MSIYIGKDWNNDFIIHTTRGMTDSDSIRNPTPISSTTYHSSGNFLNVHYHIPEIVSGNWVKFSLYTMYDMYDYQDGVWVMKPYLILVNGQIAYRSIFNAWYDNINGNIAYVSGYNNNYPWVYLHESSITNVSLIIFDINHSSGITFTEPKATSCRISQAGITLTGRTSLHTRTFISSPINSIDPLFVDSSNKQLQVINAYDYYNATPATHPVKLYRTSTGSSIDIGNKTIISSDSDMWKIPNNSVISYFIPHDTCAIGSGWDYCTSTHSWRSWLNQSFNIAVVPTNVRTILITFVFQVFVKAGTTSWTYNFNMYNSFLVSRGGTPVQVMFASTNPVSGPSGAMKLKFELATNGQLRWFNEPYGSNVGGFSVDFYRATFKIIPLDFD